MRLLDNFVLRFVALDKFSDSMINEQGVKIHAYYHGIEIVDKDTMGSIYPVIKNGVVVAYAMKRVRVFVRFYVPFSPVASDTFAYERLRRERSEGALTKLMAFLVENADEIVEKASKPVVRESLVLLSVVPDNDYLLEYDPEKDEVAEDE